MRYTTEQLKIMPILQLRGIDIKDKEEEELVQEILNARLAEMPVENPVTFSSMKTDNLTPEKEKELQAEIDARNAGIKAQFEAPSEPGPLPDPTTVPVEIPTLTEEKEPLTPEADEVVSLEKPDSKKFVPTTATAGK